jgi:hypothetical protein
MILFSKEFAKSATKPWSKTASQWSSCCSNRLYVAHRIHFGFGGKSYSSGSRYHSRLNPGLSTVRDRRLRDRTGNFKSIRFPSDGRFSDAEGDSPNNDL